MGKMYGNLSPKFLKKFSPCTGTLMDQLVEQLDAHGFFDMGMGMGMKEHEGRNSDVFAGKDAFLMSLNGTPLQKAMQKGALPHPYIYWNEFCRAFAKMVKKFMRLSESASINKRFYFDIGCSNVSCS
jgi:hypothetical protein